MFFINLSWLLVKFMKTKKDQFQNRRNIMDRFLSILWKKEVGELKYTLNI